MRFLLTFAVAVVLLGLPGVSGAFDCPLPMTAGAEEAPCSHCPDEKKESCPRSACPLICPYTVEKTAMLAAGGPPVAFVPDVDRNFVPITPVFAERAITSGLPARDSKVPPLYLLNRVFLI